jgi:hypothetical protein
MLLDYASREDVFMKKRGRIFVFLLLLPVSAHAEIFKCKSISGKIIYQPEPCANGTVPQAVIKVKEMTPQQIEEAKIKLKIWQEQQAADEATKKELEKQQQAGREKQEQLELQRRSVLAQEKQAIAAQPPPQQFGVPLLMPPYSNSRHFWNNGFSPSYNGQYDPRHNHDHEFRTVQRHFQPASTSDQQATPDTQPRPIMKDWP